MSHTWQVGKTTFVGNSDLSGTVTIVSGGVTIQIPGPDLAGFIKAMVSDAIDHAFETSGSSPRRQAGSSRSWHSGA